MKRKLIGVGGVLAMGWATAAHAGMMVRFDQERYLVPKGSTFTVHVILDADDQTPGDQNLPDGLFSMAFKVTVEGAKAQVDGVQLPGALNDDGTGRPAKIETGRDGGVHFLKVRAAAPFSVSEFYKGEDNDRGQRWMRLATVHLTDLAQETYTLGLSLLQSGAQDQVFIDGQGNVLDGELVFQSAQVEVVPVPEPASLTGLVLGGLLALGRRRSTRSG